VSDPIDISGYLLGELSDDERAAADRMIREDPGLRARVERLRPVVGRLEALPAEAWQEAHPPPLVLGEREESVPGAAPRGSTGRRRWRWPQSLTLRPFTVALASLAFLVAGLGAGVLIGSSSETSGEVEETLALEPVPPRGDTGSGSAELIGADLGEAEVDVSGLEPNAPGEFYELWLLTSPDDLVSIGSFRVDDSGSASVRVPLPVDPAEFEFIDLSIERDDGDASHSGRSVLRGPTRSA
jgi:anti-sigma-K factor RskA